MVNDAGFGNTVSDCPVKGWKRIVCKRKSGKTAGKFDVYYANPEGRRLRSMRDVSRYLKIKGIDLPLELFNFKGSVDSVRNKRLFTRVREKTSEYFNRKSSDKVGGHESEPAWSLATGFEKKRGIKVDKSVANSSRIVDVVQSSSELKQVENDRLFKFTLPRDASNFEEKLYRYRYKEWKKDHIASDNHNGDINTSIGQQSDGDIEVSAVFCESQSQNCVDSVNAYMTSNAPVLSDQGSNGSSLMSIQSNENKGTVSGAQSSSNPLLRTCEKSDLVETLTGDTCVPGCALCGPSRESAILCSTNQEKPDVSNELSDCPLDGISTTKTEPSSDVSCPVTSGSTCVHNPRCNHIKESSITKNPSQKVKKNFHTKNRKVKTSVYFKKKACSSIRHRFANKVKMSADFLPPGLQKFHEVNYTPPKSPFTLIQEDVYQDPWRLLVATIFLNKTSGQNAVPTLWKFFDSYPNAEAVTRADPAEIAKIIQPLGLFRKRPKILIRFSTEYLTKMWHYPAELYGIGKYGNDSFRIFCLGEYQDVYPDDRKLNLYHSWLCERDRQT